MEKKRQPSWKGLETLMERRDAGETAGKGEGQAQNEKSLTENKNTELEGEAVHVSRPSPLCCR